MTKSKPPDTKARSREGVAGTEGPFGQWLRRQREARGVSLREIADSTRISMRYLEALEQDRFEALPALVFARGFLREYARVVGLDPDEVVNLFLVAARDGRPPEDVAPRPTDRSARVGSPWGYGLLLGAAMVALLAVAVALSFWAERRSRTTPPAAASVVPAPGLESAASTVPAGRVDAGAPALELSSQDPAVMPSVGALEPQQAATDPAEAVETPTPLPSTAPLVVTLHFVGDCWLEAIVDGRRRPGELRIGGETVNLEAASVVELTLGNRAGVTAVANGRPLPLPAGNANVVRGFRIERAAHPAATGAPPS